MLPPEGDWRAVYWRGVAGIVHISWYRVAAWALYDGTVRGLVAAPGGGLLDAEHAEWSRVGGEFLGYTVGEEGVEDYGRTASDLYEERNPGRSVREVRVRGNGQG
jgi:hypothetical protein